ncbi:MLX-interacting protein isoform X3 [Cloeon dipterum]|uniref:MLX-interacting protein isoform X3 n=1 Tax=Cloeon dipterum TaxID=197152 RepID=UPI00321F6E8A
MQCGDLMYRRAPIMTRGSSQAAVADKAAASSSTREAIHSGHFMVSDFEAEAQDDEDLVAVPVDDDESRHAIVPAPVDPAPGTAGQRDAPRISARGDLKVSLFIDSSLTKLFQCMTVAYRQKLTSPKWNRFKGIRIRWKDKIRLNNVIWRCWHMQFIRKENTFVCQFASPLDHDMHNKPEAVVLEGKYWKRKLATVTAEYKKWRMFYKNKIMGWTPKDGDHLLGDIDMFEWHPDSNESCNPMMVDEDYMDLMSDTLFSSIAQQPFPFPNPREIARAGLAEFIQPGLVQLQPNIDDYMDTIEPLHSLHELLNSSSKLASVPEEPNSLNALESNLFRPEAPRNMDLTQNTSLASQSQTQSSHNDSFPDISLQYSNKIFGDSPNFISSRQQQQQQQQQSPAQQNQPFFFTAQDPMINQTQLPAQAQTIALTPQLSALLQESPAQNVQDHNQLSPATSSKPVQVSKSGNQGNFAVPNMNKQVKRRSHSGSSLLTNTSTPRMTSQLSMSSINLTTSQTQATAVTTDGNALLAQLLQPVQPQQQPSQQPQTYYNKPILPAPSPQQTQILTPVLVSPLALTMPGVKTTSPDLSRTSHQLANLQPKPSQNQLSGNQNDLRETASTSAVTSASFNVSPLSPPKSFRPKNDQERTQYKNFGTPREALFKNEMRRVCHINAEQKRRCNIQSGFQTLQSLIPQISQSPSAKLSKAALLHKGAEYIKQLRQDRNNLKDEIALLRSEIDSLNTSISNVQALLPASGAPVSHQRSTRMMEMFDDYVRVCTLQNWKFWVFSFLMRPLLVSYSATVSTANLDEMVRTVMQWVEQHCTLSELRPAVLNALKNICTATDILTDPSKLPEQATRAVTEQQQQQQYGHSSSSAGPSSPQSPLGGTLSYSLH